MNRIEQGLLPAASRIWPELAELRGIDRRHAAITLCVLLYAVPLSLVGLVWLILRTDLAVLAANWPIMAAIFALMLAFRQFYLFITVEVQPGVYGTTASAVESVVGWSAALIFGPTVLWLEIASGALRTLMEWDRRAGRDERLQKGQDLLLDLASTTIPGLVGLTLFERWGGSIPLAGLDLPTLLPALYATVVKLFIGTLLVLPLTGMYLSVTSSYTADPQLFRTFARSILLWFGLSYVTQPLAVVIAGLYTVSGPFVYLFILVVILAANVTGSRLSLAVERTRQRTRELEHLEQLGRAMLAAPLDGTQLPDLLHDFVPGMFSHSHVELRLFPHQTLVRHPEGWDGVPEAVWRYLKAQPQAHRLLRGSRAPWSRAPLVRHTLLLPVVDVDGGEPLGGLYIARHPSQGGVGGIFPAAHSLVAQVASALHSARVYRETLEHHRTAQELEIAGSIQASFLPETSPEIDGWQITATLVSARETSGDFFDLVPLWDGRLGIIIADVADKGVGAALYMALTRTLLRTYLNEYSTRYPDSYAFHPERILNSTNQSILHDTHSDLFVTVFLGILDPSLCTLTYANAGHNPPLLFAHEPTPGEARLRALINTCIPLGIMPDENWQRGSVALAPGDVLVMYTDGITEARNAEREFFGEAQLRRVVEAHLQEPAPAIRDAIIGATSAFIGEAPQSDDITLMILRRELPQLDA